MTEFLHELQASGRSAATQRSYAHDLLRWFRFLWVVGVPWGQATRCEARDFCRWLALSDKSRRSSGLRAATGVSNPVTGKRSPGSKYAASTVAHSETVLSTLVEHMENRYGHLRELLAQVAGAASGETVTVEGRTYRHLWSRVDERRVRLGGPANVRALDLDSGKYISVTHAEDAAFWEWAIVEVLRHSGVRIEEALELTHLSIRQYQRPNGDVIALLVVAPSKSDRERVIPMSAELFAVVAAIVRRHAAGGQTIPLLSRYDPKERRSSAPMPFLFQRKIGTKHEVISDTTVVNMLKRRCGELAEHHPGFQAASFTPHDFRRLLATDLVNSGLPIHIGAALLGHVNLQTTRGYVAVFNEDVVRHYQGFLDRRRQARPGHKMSTGRSPNPSGSGSRSTSISARSNWEAAPVPTGPLASMNIRVCAAHAQHQPQDAAPPRRDRRRHPGPPQPSRPRGLARRSRRPRPHLPPLKTRTDETADPPRARRSRHTRQPTYGAVMSRPARSLPGTESAAARHRA